MKLHTEQFFRCLADPLRLNIVLMLMHEGELCSCDLAQALDEKLSTVSRHLVLLRNKGVVKERRCELWLYYEIDQSLPLWAQQVLETVFDGNQERAMQLSLEVPVVNSRHSCL
ncbi:metalloregulator ArsR/SmtB family transcription factor [Alteromonas sp. a30]|uniref:metalloregulator ArsR/SmtB family transcription factor n=1 Tax=Alteromonas sp. a30 TaxID=2730917 RepID=UPI002282CCA8|nr:metalloregulator ArsR/SmtB family transcription factor [Alteromonas sp. a30]